MNTSAPIDSAATSVEELSFRWFFETNYQPLCQALCLLTGDPVEAEELAQEAMTRTLERWERIEKMDSPAGYAYRTAMNLNRKRIRRILVRARRSIADTPTADHSARVGDRQDIRQALAAIPSGEREALVLVDWLQMSAKEAGQVLEIAPGSVRVRVHRGRAKLREQLGEKHE